jgi:hypothetical protein
MEMGMGMAMAQQMGQMMNQQNQQQNTNQGPPPIPGAVQYFLAVNGQQQGPYTLQALQQMIASGAFTRDSMVWKQGMSAWSKAGEVADLQGFFGSMPPPIPK